MKKISENNNQFIRYDTMIEMARQQGLSIEELAKKAGITSPTILGWRMRSPKSAHLAAVADILNVSVDYLLFRTDTPWIISETMAYNSDEKNQKKFQPASFAQRLREALSFESIDLAGLVARIQEIDPLQAKKIKMSQLTAYLDGKSEPRGYRLQIFSSVLNVNSQWLLGYAVPMEISQEQVTNLLIAKCRDLPISKQKSLLELLTS